MLTRTAKTTVLAVVSLLGVGLASACDEAEPPPPTPPPTSMEQIDRMAAQNRTPDPDAVGVVLTNIALTRGDSTDKVTLGFTGDAVPGWAVHYVRQAVQNTTQAILPIAGESVIEVLVREAANPFGSAAPRYSGPETLTDPATMSVGEVRFAGEVRGVTQVFIGLRTPQRGFRVTGLSDPTRVVVEIDHR
ncbi:hypothetical protein [Nocardia sp. NPDC050406]|uniref:AMIN-like domain-containing (lipo)protein n=1 Tax=Nocardia sp. NPDC050406 TaxID=3364318 RepID=UPI00379EE7D3